MDIHKNARLSFRSREALVRFVVEQGRTRKAAAAAFRVSAKTAAKWVTRFQTAGIDGLMDRSSRPHRSPRRFAESLSSHVIELRRQHMPGYEIARRSGQVEPMARPQPATARVRYEHPRPGDLLHLDIKGMTRFFQVSLRGDGRLRGKSKHPGFLALHVAVDDHSRMAFTRMLPDQKAETTIGFLNQALDFFAQHGIKVRSLLTDNGSSYRSRQFRQACHKLAIKHHRTRPYTPRTNGKAERFIQTALREWAYAKHWTDSQDRDLHLQPCTHYYNYQRPHGSLDYKPPISRSEGGITS